MKKLVFLFLALLLIAFAAAIGGFLLSSKSSTGNLASSSSVLVWRIDRPLVERAPSVDTPLFEAEDDSMATIYRALRGARDDSSVRGVALYIQDVQFGMAKVQEIRHQIAELRKKKKFVECYLETAGEGSNGTVEYYLATACERIHLAPAGDVNLLGLLADNMFLRGTFDKLGIEANFVHIGQFKSAAETFTETENTAPAELALNALLDGYFDQIVAGIAEGRKRSPAEVRAWVDGGPYGADEALKLGMVDALGYPDEFQAGLEKRAESVQFVRLQDYSSDHPTHGHKVGVLFASGSIIRGSGGSGPFNGDSVASETMAEELRSLADDDSIRAVVLRIDSPGGSALASDLILREVERLQKKKPVIVSMSDLAASGGYYIAAKASKIVAEPATITGSIGVVGGKFVTRGLEEEKLGIRHDPLVRGANADIYSSQATFSPEQEARVLQMMTRIYETFLGHVARGRKMPRDKVHEIAQGRVWIGAEALKLGLVDRLGGLDEAIALAREAAKEDIGPLALEFRPLEGGWLDFLKERTEPLLSIEAERNLRLFLKATDPQVPGALRLADPYERLARGDS